MPPRSDRVKFLVRKGLPRSQRPKCWFTFSNASKMMEQHPDLYRTLIESEHKDSNTNSNNRMLQCVNEIERDLYRTFPDNVKFKHIPIKANKFDGTKSSACVSKRRMLSKSLMSISNQTELFSEITPRQLCKRKSPKTIINDSEVPKLPDKSNTLFTRSFDQLQSLSSNEIIEYEVTTSFESNISSIQSGNNYIHSSLNIDMIDDVSEDEFSDSGSFKINASFSSLQKIKKSVVQSGFIHSKQNIKKHSAKPGSLETTWNFATKFLNPFKSKKEKQMSKSSIKVGSFSNSERSLAESDLLSKSSILFGNYRTDALFFDKIKHKNKKAFSDSCLFSIRKHEKQDSRETAKGSLSIASVNDPGPILSQEANPYVISLRQVLVCFAYYSLNHQDIKLSRTCSYKIGYCQS